MDAAIVVYDGVSAIEVLGPHEVVRRLPGVRVRLVAVDPGPKEAHNPPLVLDVNHALEHVPHPEIVVVPGGFGSVHLMTERRLLNWLSQVHDTAQWTTAVSTGSLLLAAAGILTDVAATTHWLAVDQLREQGARPQLSRLVEDGNVITAMGGPAAIEMALLLAERIAGPDEAERIRTAMRFDPLDFDTSVPGRASRAVAAWRDNVGRDPGETSTGRRGALGWLRRRSPRRVITPLDHSTPIPVRDY